MKAARRAVAGLTMALAGVSLWPFSSATAATSDATVQAWYRQVVNDLHPLQSTLVGALDAASGWTGGTESAAAARREFNRDLPQVERVHRALENLTPLDGQTTALDDYVAGIGLYVESLEVDDAATKVPPGALRSQLQHSYQRIRELGDNVFDQGTAELAPELGAGVAGPDVAAASHVPDWSQVALTPAPPLVPTWPSVGVSASGSEPKSAWAAEVAMDGAPTQAQARTALAHPSPPSDLARMAVTFGAAETYVGSVPEPAGHPQDSNRLRLGLLVDAEAVMSAEASRLSAGVPARTLATAASALVAIGGELRAES